MRVDRSDRAWRRVLMQDPCVYCGGPAHGLDHIHASSRGGGDGWHNRAPACQSCDTRKGDASLLIFLLAGVEAARSVAPRRYALPRARVAAERMVQSQILRASIAERLSSQDHA
jgi:hypothetical protein